jgi:hypothetical protein
MLKIYNSSFKYDKMDITVSMVFKCSLSICKLHKYTHTHTHTHTHRYLILTFSIKKVKIRVSYVDASCAENSSICHVKEF